MKENQSGRRRKKTELGCLGRGVGAKSRPGVHSGRVSEEGIWGRLWAVRAGNQSLAKCIWAAEDFSLIYLITMRSNAQKQEGACREDKEKGS